MNRNLSMKKISDIICEYHDIEEKNVFIRTRKRDILIVRQIIQYFSCKYTTLNGTEIGSYLGCDFDRTTVISSRKTVEDLFDSDLKFRDTIGYLNYKLKGLNDSEFDAKLEADSIMLKKEINNISNRDDFNKILFSYIDFN